jgi:hypothetical protein
VGAAPDRLAKPILLDQPCSARTRSVPTPSIKAIEGMMAARRIDKSALDDAMERRTPSRAGVVLGELGAR